MTVPKNSRTFQSHHMTVPKKRLTFASHQMTVPKHRRTFQSHQMSVTRNRRTCESHHMTAPNKRRTFQSHQISVSRNRRTCESHHMTAPNKRRTCESHQMTVPKKRRTFESHQMTVPKQSRTCMRILPDSMIQYACITRQKTINEESFLAPETNRNKSSNEACTDNDFDFLMNNVRYLSREMPKALPQNLKSRRIAQLETYSSCVPRSQVKSIFFPCIRQYFSKTTTAVGSKGISHISRVASTNSRASERALKISSCSPTQYSAHIQSLSRFNAW